MNRKLFLHVGPPKTGTTAIQAYFSNIISSEIFYPKTGRWSDGSHHLLTFAHRGRTSYGDVQVPPWALLEKALSTEISSTNRNVLISSEACQPDFINALKPIVNRLSMSLEIVMVIRNPLQRAASFYNQRVKDPVVGLSAIPDQFLLENASGFKVRPFFEKWQSYTDKIWVMPYNNKEPLVEVFCNLIGVKFTTFYKEQLLNRSMGGKALLTLLTTNKLLTNEEERREFFFYLSQENKLDIWNGNSFPFSKNASKIFLDQNLDDTDWINNKLNISSTGNIIPEKFKIDLNCIADILSIISSFRMLNEEERASCENLLNKFKQ